MLTESAYKGAVQAPFFMKQEYEMRHKVRGKSYSKKFNKAHKRTKAVNRPGSMARGGFRF